MFTPMGVNIQMSKILRAMFHVAVSILRVALVATLIDILSNKSSLDGTSISLLSYSSESI